MGKEKVERAKRIKKFNRLNDRFFKFLFANPEHKELLIEFLNEVLADVPEGAERLPPVVDLSFADRETSPAYEDDKVPRFDVLATLANGWLVHIEVQLEYDENLLPRVLHYVARDYFFCTRRGEDYASVRVICIVLADFRLFKKTESYHTLHRILNVEDGTWQMRGMEFHFIEIPKLKGRRPETGLERLLRYLGGGGKEEMQTIAAEDARVAKMVELEGLFRSDPNLLRDYLTRERERWDYRASLKASEARGEARGEKRGEARGEKRGRNMEQENLAVRMLRAGRLALEEIAEYSGLTLRKVKALQRKMA